MSAVDIQEVTASTTASWEGDAQNTHKKKTHAHKYMHKSSWSEAASILVAISVGSWGSLVVKADVDTESERHGNLRP